MNLRILYTLLLSIVLAACEAPLVLDRVEGAKADPVRRTDRIQAAASMGDEVVVVGVGLLLNSSDAGKTWRRTSPDGLPTFIGVTLCADKTQVAVSAEKQAWVSTDNGKTWRANDLGTEESPQYISCGPGNKLWVAASFSTLLSSSDHGQTWQQTSLDEDLIFTYINFFDVQRGIAIGEFGSVYSTEDAGESWVAKEQPIANEFYPMAVSFADSQHGWIGGSNGVILHTSDGGNSWLKEETGSEAPIYGLLANTSGVYAVGGFGTFLERKVNDDGTVAWTQSSAVSTRFYLRAITPLGNNKVLLGGGAGTLRSLIDDGSGQLIAASLEQGV
ncbi:MAG: YCF48-related protein [Cycloclasticus sp.]|nr:YCF48-related protein [Cycloclasticus sp.]